MKVGSTALNILCDPKYFRDPQTCYDKTQDLGGPMIPAKQEDLKNKQTRSEVKTTYSLVNDTMAKFIILPLPF